MKKFAALLPFNWIEGTPQDACFDEAWQTVGDKEADFRKELERL
ncbi:hypothetical protein [Peribacillus frigoritolerans]|nr:hypothetical protein [Peribacillus frigoritolerans]